MTDSLLCCNSCDRYHFDYVFMKHCLYLKKKAGKFWAPKFWPSYHYSSVVQTASNWNLQKLLKSEL